MTSSHRYVPDIRRYLLEISDHLTKEDVENLKFLVPQLIPAGKGENVTNGRDFFIVLERENCLDLNFLCELFVDIKRANLADCIKRGQFDREAKVYRENQEGLVVQGYSVKIVGGKHYSTLRGEYVELKTGMNFQLHVTNNNPKACHLDIEIEKKYIGGWVLAAHEDAFIERPTDTPLKFLFYKMGTLDSVGDDGEEYGTMTCQFTPEKDNMAVDRHSRDIPEEERRTNSGVEPGSSTGTPRMRAGLTAGEMNSPHDSPTKRQGGRAASEHNEPRPQKHLLESAEGKHTGCEDPEETKQEKDDSSDSEDDNPTKPFVSDLATLLKKLPYDSETSGRNRALSGVDRSFPRYTCRNPKNPSGRHHGDQASEGLPKNWRAGSVALKGASNQIFFESHELEVDESKSVLLELRMVTCAEDEGEKSSHNYTPPVPAASCFC